MLRKTPADSNTLRQTRQVDRPGGFAAFPPYIWRIYTPVEIRLTAKFVSNKFNRMEQISFPQNIETIYIEASSFPDGVKAAHEKLHALVPPGNGRRFFGISYPGRDGKITYKAAAETLGPEEAKKLGLDTFTIRKGRYISETLTNWPGREMEIGGIFNKLLDRPAIASDGYCLEEYLDNNELRLMVTLFSI
jgi:predicted transcriptional regulator YdeE